MEVQWHEKQQVLFRLFPLLQTERYLAFGQSFRSLVVHVVHQRI